MSHLRFNVVEEAFNRKAVPVEIPAERPEVYYAEKVFNRQKMFQYLPKKTYEVLIDAIETMNEYKLSDVIILARGRRIN